MLGIRRREFIAALGGAAAWRIAPSNAAEKRGAIVIGNGEYEKTDKFANPSYFVQLSMKKSQAEARASFRGLQAEFPEQLGDLTPIIRRTDVGDKVYYRATVGPFANAYEAGRFCGNYRAAGGQCIIQKN